MMVLWAASLEISGMGEVNLRKERNRLTTNKTAHPKNGAKDKISIKSIAIILVVELFIAMKICKICITKQKRIRNNSKRASTMPFWI